MVYNYLSKNNFLKEFLLHLFSIFVSTYESNITTKTLDY